MAGNAIRPGDVLATRKGLSIEIGNTDAEGRVVLADALAVADEETPYLLIDCATLTGAARVALGPSLPPFYTPDDDLAQAITHHAEAQADPLWRMPLWAPYREMINSEIADINNAGDSPFAVSPRPYSSRISSPQRGIGCISTSTRGTRKRAPDARLAARRKASARSTA